MQPRPPRPTLFPYTTLFRSRIRNSPTSGSGPTRRGKYPRRLASTSKQEHSYAQDEDQERRQKAFPRLDRKSTRLNSSHSQISYAVFCLKKKKRKAVRDIQTL